MKIDKLNYVKDEDSIEDDCCELYHSHEELAKYFRLAVEEFTDRGMLLPVDQEFAFSVCIDHIDNPIPMKGSEKVINSVQYFVSLDHIWININADTKEKTVSYQFLITDAIPDCSAPD